MTPRDRRLLSDARGMEELATTGALTYRAAGDPPDRYEVLLQAPGLARAPSGALAVRTLHRFEAYLHLDYPRRPPVLTWQTPVFHPNLLDRTRNGGVCLGSWSASESLADLCARLSDLVAWRTFNTGDALDHEAADWAVARAVRPGMDVRCLVGLPPSAAPAVVLQRGGTSHG